MSMSELARHSRQPDIRGKCRMSMAELARHSSRRDIPDQFRMSISELGRHLSSSLFGTFAECRCQSWLDIRPSSIFGTSPE
ncbi:hypothetical protein DPMN_112929 [Dreissena polymorpha]|uniref:Uncharacterized protein n=1 Tax=Dreissena polymorpha TaxID=45954 RepID=A0A9D4KGM1_DREPO|nr:hypothetical protein DPMN_112929 [Dreissena polymorpha]